MIRTIGATIIAVAVGFASGAQAEEITIGIGTQDTTTNTVTTGVVIRQLHLLEKFLPHDGKYAGAIYTLDWQNFTSGPPVTNAMIAGKLQFGAMGDFPLLVNGFTFQSNPDSHSQLIAVAAYNAQGAGNAVLVNAASPYFKLNDLKGKVVSVPFGSAAHGMVLAAMQANNWPANYFRLVNQSPEIGATNLQEQKIDAHADFVPFGELLPFRGFARKIYDGAQTGLATWHGVVVRTDFAQQYPEIVTAYVRAILAANADHNRPEAHRALAANAFAQAEALMVGRSDAEIRAEMTAKGASAADIDAIAPHRVAVGERPSNTIMFNRLDPFSVGRLIALYEHKVAVQGCLWGIDSFDQWGVELGKQLASGILPELTPAAGRKDQAHAGKAGHDSSTTALIHRFLTLRGDA